MANLANKVIYSKRVTLFLFLFSLLISLAFVFYRHDFYSPQTWEHGVLAQNFINGLGLSFSYFGNPLQPSSIMAPFYTFFLSFFYLITGITPTTYIIVQILQAVAQALSVVLIYHIAGKLFNKPIAIISALLLAIFPVFIYSVTLIHQLTFTLLFIVLFVFYLLKLRENPTLKTQIICGAILGLTALTEPTILFFVPFVVIWILWEQRSWRNSLKTVACILGIAILMITPWMVRNYQVHDEFVFIKMSGFNFYRGNTPPAIITGVPHWLEGASPSLRETLKNSSEAEGDRILRNEALQYIKENPKIFVVSFLRKAYYFWWFPKMPESDEYQVNTLRKVAYAPLLLFAVGGLFMSFRSWRRFLPLYFLFISFTIGYALFFVLPRYRVPTIEPFMIIFASYALYTFVGNLRARLKKGSPLRN